MLNLNITLSTIVENSLMFGYSMHLQIVLFFCFIITVIAYLTFSCLSYMQIKVRNYCDYEATWPCDLKMHHKSEHDGFPYSCKLCHCKIKHEEDLKAHKNTWATYMNIFRSFQFYSWCTFKAWCLVVL